MAFLKRLLWALPMLLVSPVLMAVSFLALAATDLFWKLFGRRVASVDAPPASSACAELGPPRASAVRAELGQPQLGAASTDAPRRSAASTDARRSAASVVIPNWNGKDLLAKYLPSVAAALAGNPDNEIVVVDNGSTDGSAEFVRTAFPRVKLGRKVGLGPAMPAS